MLLCSNFCRRLVHKANLTRQLTKHVVTRWYRAPELILIQPYTSAVDIWSLGCIFAELLSMQEGNVPGYQDRKPLFPGGTCYPLSGEGDSIKADERLDQLSVIFSVIGTPPPEDIEASGKAHEYIAALPKTKGKPLETLYPAADPAAIDLLKKMLHFNPKRRVTAEEALEHEFFKGVRRKELERTADGPLTGPDFLESDNIDLRLVKQRTYEEVIWYRDHGGQKTPSSERAAPSGE
jgi:mitogen-activated protein kinase 1/3